MWKTETTLLDFAADCEVLSFASVGGWADWQLELVHMYGAIDSFPGPARLPPTKWCWRIGGGIARWGRDSLNVVFGSRRD